MSSIVCVIQRNNQFLVECDLKLPRMSVIICPYLANFITYNKSNTAFLHEILIIFFSRFYKSQTTYVISSFNLRKDADAIIP